MGLRAMLGLGLTAVLLGGASLADSKHLSPALRATPPPARKLAPRVECRHPRTLRLRRFEDGSAQLRCAGDTLVRVSVPG